MSLKVTCAKCGGAQAIPDEYRGRVVKCIKCGEALEAEPARPPLDSRIVNEAARLRAASKQHELDAPLRQHAEYAWNVRVAGVLSFFAVGAGQVYKGDVIRGVVMAVVQWTLYAAMLLVNPGSHDAKNAIVLLTGLVALAIWVFGIFDAIAVPRLGSNETHHHA